MRYWWVNQNQTYRHEISGGYLWSPKRKSNGNRNPYYEFMREVAPGDLIFSFYNTYINGVGRAQSFAYESPKPTEFGKAGDQWGATGWRIDIEFNEFSNPFRPAAYIETLRPELPKKYSPLQRSGRGNQAIYLTSIPLALARAIIELAGESNLLTASNEVVSGEGKPQPYKRTPGSGALEWEEQLIKRVWTDSSLSRTEKLTIVLARRGQGVFKSNVMQVESKCRITHVDQVEHLRASHIKPWRDCNQSTERLSANNGLLLTPSIDHLFDRGFISFEDNGRLLISPVAHLDSLQRLGIETQRKFNVGEFNADQKSNLEYHRNNVFLESQIN